MDDVNAKLESFGLRRARAGSPTRLERNKALRALGGAIVEGTKFPEPTAELNSQGPEGLADFSRGRAPLTQLRLTGSRRAREWTIEDLSKLDPKPSVEGLNARVHAIFANPSAREKYPRG